MMGYRSTGTRYVQGQYGAVGVVVVRGAGGLVAGIHEGTVAGLGQFGRDHWGSMGYPEVAWSSTPGTVEVEIMGDDCSPRGGDWEENQIYSCNNRRDAFPANIGRPSYTSLLATCQRLQRQNSDQEEQLALANQRIASLKLRNARLEDKVQSATIALEEQEKLRNRFISTFKRDKLHSDTPADRGTIREGNESAHGGDAISDAQLYTSVPKRPVRPSLA
ncbi:hypothetical protein HOY80DRAFT_1071173 [Tuber brumale]|nr:hypothetical protein HOY80DRAFT_1071173 [Tuber brumale]